MGKTADIPLADSNSDDLEFLDRHLGKIFVCSLIVSYALEIAAVSLVEQEEQEELRIRGYQIGTIAALVRTVGQILTFIGFVQRSRDRDRRRRATQQS